MRILLITSSYYPVIGGLQTIVRALARYLKDNGNEVIVATNRYPRSLRAREVVDGVNVYRYYFLSPSSDYLRRTRLDLFLASLYFYPASTFYLRSLVRRFQPEVVNVHYPLASTPFVLGLRKRYRFRLIVSLHGYEIERWFDINTHYKFKSDITEKKLYPAEHKWLQSLVDQADAVTACSRYLLDKAIELFPAISAKGQVVYNGVDISQFQLAEPYQHPKPYILAFGRLSYQKGFDILLEAFAQTVSNSPGVDLIIVGEGEEEKALKAQVHNLGLHKRMHFFSGYNFPAIIPFIKGCKFVVVPSRWEPFGMVILEAFACGKPVIATSSGGPQELIRHGVNGFLVDKENPQALAAAMDSLIMHPEMGETLGRAANERAAEFGIETMVSSYIKLFKEGAG